MKKILYIVRYLNNGGPIIVLKNIIKYLDRDKFEPVILTLSSEATSTLISFFTEDMKVMVYSLNQVRFKRVFFPNFFMKEKIEKFIKNHDIDLVHSHGFGVDRVVSNIDTLRISTIHNYPFKDYKITNGQLVGFVMSNLHLRYLKKMDKVFACSRSNSLLLASKHNFPIPYIQNGTDTSEWKNKKITSERGIFKEGVTVYISVGYLSKLKDPVTIIKAYKRANLKKSILVFLGSGSLSNSCLKEAENRSDILFFGHVTNVGTYLKESDYFVSASHTEGMPNTVLEAMAFGLPCLLSNIPPHAEINSIDINSSILFNLEDVDGLSQKFKSINLKKYSSMSEASKNIAVNYLSAEIMSNKYQKIYVELLKINEKTT